MQLTGGMYLQLSIPSIYQSAFGRKDVVKLKKRVSAKYDKLLANTKVILHEIRLGPLITPNDYHQLHMSNQDIEKLLYDTLGQWVRSTRNAIEKKFSTEQNIEYL